MSPLGLLIIMINVHFEATLLTSNQILAILDELTRLIVRVANELFEAEKVQDVSTQVEEGRQTQQDDQHGKVDVEAVAYEWNDVHMTHDARELGLENVWFSCDVTVKMD